VTTSSLEALQAYSLGHKAQVKNDPAASIPFFQRAFSLDPNFAMAYARLGRVYFDLGENARADEMARKAYDLRGRTSEWEELYIASHYQQFVVGNLEAARASYELWAQTYPADYSPRTGLQVIYNELGQYDKGLTAAQEALKMNPASVGARGNLIGAYLPLNRLDDAKAAATEARSRKLDGPSLHLNLYPVDFLQHDAAAMEREAAGLMGKPGYEDLMLYLESNTAAYGGELAKARELTRRSVDSAQRADQKETAAGRRAGAAIREALAGNVALAMQEARAAVELANGQYVKAFSALALVLAGDSAQAERLASDLSKRFPEDTIVQFEYLPMIHAAIGLRSSYAGKAVEALAVAAPYEMGYAAGLYPVYLRGEAYLAARQGHAAEIEFQKILDHPGVVENDLIGALAHLGLGRAYALAGDIAKARTAYQDFFALWKNADPVIPILMQAKAEYAKLK
jgi:tetratricopeptide (TPR) repeat protein